MSIPKRSRHTFCDFEFSVKNIKYVRNLCEALVRLENAGQLDRLRTILLYKTPIQNSYTPIRA